MVLSAFHVRTEQCITMCRYIHSFTLNGVSLQPQLLASLTPWPLLNSLWLQSPLLHIKYPPFFLLAVLHHSTGVYSQPTQQSSRRSQLSITTSKFQTLLDQKQAVRIPPSTPIFSQITKQRWRPLPSPSRWSKLLRKIQRLLLHPLMVRPTSLLLLS